MGQVSDTKTTVGESDLPFYILITSLNSLLKENTKSDIPSVHRYYYSPREQWTHGGCCFAYAIAYILMRDLHYKNRIIRMDDKIWQALKAKRKKSGLSWNLFIRKLLKV